MSVRVAGIPQPLPEVVRATGEDPLFHEGDDIKILTRKPIGHFRVPNYVRGKRGRVEAVVRPMAINNEDEGFGRNAGEKRHYYRIAIPMTELWSNYSGPAADNLRIEVFETWLERKLSDKARTIMTMLRSKPTMGCQATTRSWRPQCGNCWSRKG